MHRSNFLRALMFLGAAVLAACGGDTAPPMGPPNGGAAIGPHTYHLVGSGQSLDDIARIYHVPKAGIIAANRLSAPYNLKPGTMLDIPIGIAVPAAAEKPKPKPPTHAHVTRRPSRTTGDQARAGSPKPKQPEPKVIPLD